jgi:hypothetical protein
VEEISQWNIQTVKKLIADGVSESLTLEYKRSGALEKSSTKIKEISKDISALANSAGGILIYGVIEEGNNPISIDEGSDINLISREWLEQIINTNIQRRIEGVVIKQITLEGDQDKAIFLVKVPQSSSAPHMAADNRYYKRFNFQSIPMEDYEVRDVSRRLSSPDLQIRYDFGDLGGNQKPNGLKADTEDFIWLTPVVSNLSWTPVDYAVFSICIDRRMRMLFSDSFSPARGALSFKIGADYVATRAFDQNHGIPGSMPIWNGVSFRLTRSALAIAFPKKQGLQRYYLGWTASAPNMPIKHGLYYLECEDGNFSIGEISESEYSPYLYGNVNYLN